MFKPNCLAKGDVYHIPNFQFNDGTTCNKFVVIVEDGSRISDNCPYIKVCTLTTKNLDRPSLTDVHLSIDDVYVPYSNCHNELNRVFRSCKITANYNVSILKTHLIDYKYSLKDQKILQLEIGIIAGFHINIELLVAINQIRL